MKSSHMKPDSVSSELYKHFLKGFLTFDCSSTIRSVLNLIFKWFAIFPASVFVWMCCHQCLFLKRCFVYFKPVLIFDVTLLIWCLCSDCSKGQHFWVIQGSWSVSLFFIHVFYIFLAAEEKSLLEIFAFCHYLLSTMGLFKCLCYLSSFFACTPSFLVPSRKRTRSVRFSLKAPYYLNECWTFLFIMFSDSTVYKPTFLL